MGWVANATTLPLCPRKRPGTHYGRLGAFQDRSGQVRKISPHLESNSKPSIPWRVAKSTTLLWPFSLLIRGGADKSLARPGRKQATANKLGNYSTYSPRRSIHFLDRCSNFCKPLKNIQKFVRPTRSLRQQWPLRRK